MTARLSLLLLGSLVLGCNVEDPDEETPDDTDTPEVGNDIVDIALGDDDFSILAGAIVDAGLEDTLRGDGPFTVFAPTNAAFEGVDLGGLSTADLATILQYHVVSGEVDSASVPGLADSVNAYTLFFDTSSGVTINGGITVTTTDIEADNGIIHVIDGILTPPNIVEAATWAGLTELTTAVGAADPAVATILSEPGDYTVFAPNNAAFSEISSVTAGLSQAELTAVLSYHVIGGARVDSGSVPGMADTLLANEWGNGVTALFDTSNGVVINGSSNVVIADVRTTNGIVHVIDEVLLPPTVVDHAVNAGLGELIRTVDAASGDLGTVLSGAGPFTVFAPTDQAFLDIAATTATLNADQLASVLLYHVADADVPVLSTDLGNGEVDTLNGQTVTVDLTGGVFINDAEVIAADVNATNGVVHVIDAVLVPSL